MDITEQMKRQKQHRSPGDGLEPYVGAIISPYNSSIGSRAEISFFCTDYPKDKEIRPDADPVVEGCLPMSLEVSISCSAVLLLQASKQSIIIQEQEALLLSTPEGKVKVDLQQV